MWLTGGFVAWPYRSKLIGQEQQGIEDHRNDTGCGIAYGWKHSAYRMTSSLIWLSRLSWLKPVGPW